MNEYVALGGPIPLGAQGLLTHSAFETVTERSPVSSTMWRPEWGMAFSFFSRVGVMLFPLSLLGQTTCDIPSPVFLYLLNVLSCSPRDCESCPPRLASHRVKSQKQTTSPKHDGEVKLMP